MNSLKSKTVIFILLIFFIPIILFKDELSSNLIFNVYRYFFIPIFFLLYTHKYFINNLTLQNFLSLNEKRIYYFVVPILIFLFYSSKFLKLTNFTYPLFDSGIYLNHEYLIFNSKSLIDGFKISIGLGHFQPIKLLYSFLFYFKHGPFILYFIQTLILFSSIFPLYKILILLNLPIYNRVLFILIFSLSPVIYFQDILGFHPDVLITTLVFWAFYFLLLRKFFILFILLLFISFCGEQWITLCIGFSIFIIFNYSKLFGLLFLSFYLSLFYVCLFYILPSFNSENAFIFSSNSSDILLVSRAFPYGWIHNFSINEFLNVLFTPRKLFFLIILFLPFLFIPLFSKIFLFICGPDILKLVLSSEPLHYAIEGHYLVSIIPFSIISCIYYVVRYHKYNLVIYFFSLQIASGIGHSPFPYSYDFWLDTSSSDFNYKNYHDKLRKSEMNNLLNSLPINKFSKIEITNNAFSYPLANSFHQLKLFPSSEWEMADFIIIDSIKPHTSGGILSENVYIYSFNEAYRIIKLSHNLCYKNLLYEAWCKK